MVYAFENELAQTLTDCLLRRTMVGLNSTSGLSSVEAAAIIAQNHLGWSKDRVTAEVSSYRKYVERFRLNRETTRLERTLVPLEPLKPPV